ncbi:conserved Plasmodium protein, unknown function [Plasmodium malariae]|uniref:ADF-H domain-containing protein n=1 Tax=Plasmodium malariae TaxID=5858 RepID=A0A1C3L3B7_PLAMA|nr:conserved Plasmodium protein, unknown function [Plasmodium malariae]
MRRNVSPSLQREITLCNSQKNNKSCFVFSLNSKFQLILGGYSEQRESLKEDVENLKLLLNYEICFILFNVNKYTPKCKWVFILWTPDENVHNALKWKEKKVYIKKNSCIQIFEKEKKYSDICYMNKLIYHNVKNNVIDIIDDNDVSLLEINNFDELETCITTRANYANNHNLADLERSHINKQNNSFHSDVNNHLYNCYFLNSELWNCYSALRRRSGSNDSNKGGSDNMCSSLMTDVKLLANESNTCLNMLKVNVDDLTLSSHHLIIDNIEAVQDITQDQNIFYIIYKILDSYTFFYVCNYGSCTTKEKFVYSFFKPHIIEFLKKKNIHIFLSVEMGKVKHLINFINSDVVKKRESMVEENSLEENSLYGKNVKMKKEGNNLIIQKVKNNKNIFPINESVIIEDKESFEKQSNNNESVHNLIMKKYSFNSRASNMSAKKSSNTNSTSISLKKHSLSVDQINSFNLKNKKKNFTTSSTRKCNSASYLSEKRVSLKLFNIKNENLSKFAIEEAVGGKKKKKEKKSKTLPTLLKSKSLSLNKYSSISLESKKSYALDKQNSLDIDKKKKKLYI